jgi:hypothetical protein
MAIPKYAKHNCLFIAKKQLRVSAIEYRRFQVFSKNKMEVFTVAWWEISEP